MGCAMSAEHTTAVVQRYLDELAGDSLQANEVLDAVEERVLKALRAARPRTVRELFALASRHMRRELNDLARRLDEQPAVAELRAGLVWAPASSVSGLSPDGDRLLPAIGELPEDNGRPSTWCGSTGWRRRRPPR
jgi:hypothetical protein